MTAATVSAARPTAQRASSARLTFGGVLKSEWIKLWTLRSTVWTLAITVVVMVGIALMFAAIINIPDVETSGADGASMSDFFPSATIVTIGYSVGQLAIAVLGVLAITGEYSTGMIRSTFSAVPRRLPAFFAKLAVLFVTSFVVTLLGVGLSALVTAPLLSNQGMALDLGSSDNVRILVGAALYVATISALSLGIGALLRSTAGAIFTVVGLLMVVPQILSIVAMATGNKVVENIYKFLPGVAGERLLATGGSIDPMTGASASGALEPWVGYGVLAGWTVLVLVVAAVLLKRRDA